MIMSESEILTSIRTAANQWEQVQVVADLNAMSRKEMEKYLTSIGFELPTRTDRRGRKPGTTVKKAADTKVVGSALRELFGVSSTTVRIDGVVKRIYICNVDGFDIDELGIRRKK